MNVPANENPPNVTVDINPFDRGTVAVTVWESRCFSVRHGFSSAVSPTRAREIAAELIVAADAVEESHG